MSPKRWQLSTWFESNGAKKYYVGSEYMLTLRQMFNSKGYDLRFWHRYRFNDKFSLNQEIFWNPIFNDAGYARMSGNDIIFSRRDRRTIENVLSAKYNFNNRSGITFRARHYWSKVEQKELFNLETDGRLEKRQDNTLPLQHQNFNAFNIDAVYTLQFAPGSFINVVWKNSIYASNQEIDYTYFKNAGNTLSSPQNNSLSIRVIYFLDYLNLKRKKAE